MFYGLGQRQQFHQFWTLCTTALDPKGALVCKFYSVPEAVKAEIHENMIRMSVMRYV